MAFDVAVKAVDANDMQRGDLLVLSNGSGDTQRRDETEYLPTPPDDTALSGFYYNRFDNKGYY